MPVLDATDLQAISDELAGDAGFLAAIAAQVAASAVASVTGDVGGNVVGSIGSLANQAKTDVQTEITTAFVANNIDHLMLAAVDTSFEATVHADSVIGHLASPLVTSTFNRTTDSLEAIASSGGGGITANDVWTHGTRTLTALDEDSTTIDLNNTAIGSVANGVTLADGAITDAKFTIPTISGVATGPVGFITQLWRRLFKKSDHDEGAGTVKTYADNGTTVLTTQTVTIVGDTTTVGDAS